MQSIREAQSKGETPDLVKTARGYFALVAKGPPDVDESVRAAVWQSRRYFDPGRVRALAAAQFDRCFYPEGATRQLAAIYATGDRTARLQTLDVPTLVIHGRDDTLITPSGGEATAAAVRGSAYLLLADMGHDRPRPLWPALTQAIAGHTRAGAARRA